METVSDHLLQRNVLKFFDFPLLFIWFPPFLRLPPRPHLSIIIRMTPDSSPKQIYYIAQNFIKNWNGAEVEIHSAKMASSYSPKLTAVFGAF